MIQTLLIEEIKRRVEELLAESEEFRQKMDAFVDAATSGPLQREPLAQKLFAAMQAANAFTRLKDWHEKLVNYNDELQRELAGANFTALSEVNKCMLRFGQRLAELAAERCDIAPSHFMREIAKSVAEAN